MTKIVSIPGYNTGVGTFGASKFLPFLDLQFALDKTFVAHKGPAPTLTRASIGTYFGPNTIIVNGIALTQQSGLILNGRFIWQSPSPFVDEYDYQARYNGSRWVMRVRYRINSDDFDEYEVFAAIGNEWRPDDAGWSGNDITVTTGNTFGIVIAAINEPRFEYDPVTLECLGLSMESQSVNRIFPSTTLTTQTRAVAALIHTLSFYGTGTVVLSGAHSATVIGISSTTRKTYTFTPSSGNLTLTVIGSVTFAQLERLGIATSYIRTTSAIVARSSDIFGYQDISEFYNENAGTVVIELILRGVVGQSPYSFIFGNNQNGISAQQYGDISDLALTGSISNDETSSFTSTLGTLPYEVPRKIAMAFEDQGSAIICLNGTLGTQDDSITLPLDANNGHTPTNLDICISQFSIISSFRYYKKRLPNSKLQILTTADSNLEAQAYINAVRYAGAIVTTVQEEAIVSFIASEKSSGRWDKLRRFYLPIWGTATPNAICMKSRTSGTFVGNLTHAAGYVVSSRTGGYMDTSTTLGNLNVSVSSYHFAVLLKTRPLGGDNYQDTPYGVSNMYPAVEDGNENYFIPAPSIGAIFSENIIKDGIFTIGGNASSRYLKNRDSNSVDTIIDNTLFTQNFTNHNVFLLRANGSDRLQSSSAQTAAFSIGTALTDAEDTAYTANLKTLWETTTGLTLS